MRLVIAGVVIAWTAAFVPLVCVGALRVLIQCSAVLRCSLTCACVLLARGCVHGGLVSRFVFVFARAAFPVCVCCALAAGLRWRAARLDPMLC